METLVAIFADMPFWGWWAIAFVLLILEIMTGSTYLLWPAAAAILVGFADIWPLDGRWRVQLGLFAGVTIVLTLVAPKYARPWIDKARADHPHLNKRGDQKIGKHAVAAGAFNGGAGKVRFGDTVWLARCEADLADGAEVVISAVDGTTLLVEAV